MTALTDLLAPRAKAFAGAVATAVAVYVAVAVQAGTAITLHGVEGAAAGAVLAFLGVHQTPNRKKRPALVGERGPEVSMAPIIATNSSTTSFSLGLSGGGRSGGGGGTITWPSLTALLPKPTSRKLGHLPSPRDDRDHRYTPDKAKAALTVHNAAGLTFDALGNLSVGDCGEAGEEHLRQVIAHINGLTYTPTVAETVAMYSRITGYRPGDPSTDNGTVLRQMLSDLHKQGIITEYQAVPTDVASLRSAIATHGGVLCGFALPTGAEPEGVKWRVPRVGKAAGSWGGHCVPLVGSTSELFDLISWGEVGTASHGFVNDYIDEAWVVTYADSALTG